MRALLKSRIRIAKSNVDSYFLPPVKYQTKAAKKILNADADTGVRTLLEGEVRLQFHYLKLNKKIIILMIAMQIGAMACRQQCIIQGCKPSNSGMVY